MELDMEVHHHEASLPIGALSTMADALPGLGIVAAVLGVVITMGALGGPPEEIGHKVAAALVGHFWASFCAMEWRDRWPQHDQTSDDHNSYLHVLRVLMLSFLKGSAPMIAIEMDVERFLRMCARVSTRWRRVARTRLERLRKQRRLKREHLQESARTWQPARVNRSL